MKLQTFNHHPHKRPPTLSVLKALGRLKHKDFSWPHHLSIIWVDDRTIARLCKNFLGVSHATDVLTFSDEIVVSLDTAYVQARQRRLPVAHELTLLVLHGLLHLHGFRDKTVREQWEMRRAEFTLLMSIL